MKYLIIVVLFCSCNSMSVNDDADKNRKTGYGIQKVKVDKCEYILFNHVEKAALVHAGDCSNPNHSK